MRIANLAGRLVLLDGELAIDVETASNGRFDAEPQAVYSRWAEFTEWAATADLPRGSAYDPLTLVCRLPRRGRSLPSV